MRVEVVDDGPGVGCKPIYMISGAGGGVKCADEKRRLGSIRGVGGVVDYCRLVMGGVHEHAVDVCRKVGAAEVQLSL